MKMTYTHIHCLELNDENIEKITIEIKRYLLTHLKDLKKDGYKLMKLEMKFTEEFR